MNDTIPKIIHQLWLQTEKYVPKKYQLDTIRTRNLNKDFKYMFWDEIKILNLIKNNPEYMEKYYSFPYMHQKIDFAKYIILYTFGGIFIDMDAYCIKSLNGLYDMVQHFDVVLSYINAGFVSNIFMCEETKCVNNGNIMCKPRADFIKYLIDEIILIKECNFYDLKMTCIFKTTGPTLLNKLLRNYNGPSKIRVLDPEYIEPCMMDMCDVTKNTYIKHEHAASWSNEPFKSIGYVYIHYEFHFWCLIISLIIVIIICCIFFKYQNNYAITK